MAAEIKMPQMGESITEGTLVRWHVRPGDRVARDDILFEISTDKVDTEVPSPETGYVSEILVEEGKTVPVDTIVCRLGDEPPGADAAHASPGAESTAGTTAPAPAASPADPDAAAGAPGPERSPGEIRLSPAVRRLVAEHGLDVSSIPGSGDGGRVTRNDVLRWLETHGDDATGSPSPDPAAPAPTKGEGDRAEPLSHLRRRIAEHMARSVRTSPHATVLHEADMSAVLRLRETLRERWRDRGVRPTYMPFFVQASATALREFPAINASLSDSEVIYRQDVHISVAVNVDDGLIVPVVRHADRKSIFELTEDITDVVRRTRTKKLLPDEVKGGTFTVTNPGGFGTLTGAPILNQPQVGILCVGAVQKRVVVLPESDAIAVRPMAYVSLTFDHRLIDGAMAGRFVARLTRILEDAEFRAEP